MARLWLALLMIALGCSYASADVRFDAIVTLPDDNGSPIGSIFHVDGNLAGAGFGYSNGSHRTSNPRVVTFFAKGSGGALQISSLGKPFTDAANFSLLSMEDELVAVSYNPLNLKPRRYDGLTWQDLPMPNWTNGVTVLGGFLVVGGKPLYLYNSPAVLHYDGSPVTGDSRWVGKPAYGMVYTAGKLYIFTQPGGVDYVYVCDWAPGQGAVSNCTETSLGRDTVWPYTIFPTTSGIAFGDSAGWVQQVFPNGTLGTIRVGNGSSFQIYTAVRWWWSRWWLGHYPSGNLLRWADLVQQDPPIGKQACSSSVGREAQSAIISMGQPTVGMWPWGEIWTGEPGQAWSLLTRLFPYPASACTVEAPFIPQALAAGVPESNALGQRAYSLASFGRGIAASATMKNASYGVALNQLSSGERAAYGSVVMIDREYELSCEVPGAGTMTLSFIIDGSDMEIRKDDVLLCSRAVNPANLPDLSGPLSMTIGDGPWGQFIVPISGFATSR